MAANKIRIIGIVVEPKYNEKKGVFEFQLQEVDNNSEIYHVVVLEKDVDSAIIEGEMVLVEGPFTMKRKGSDLKLICGADEIIPLKASEPVSESVVEEKSIIEESESVVEEVKDEATEVPTEEPLETTKSVSTETVEDEKVEKKEEHPSQTQPKLGEFGLPLPSDINIFASKPIGTKSTDTKKDEAQNKEVRRTDSSKKSDNSSPKGRFTMDDFDVE